MKGLIFASALLLAVVSAKYSGLNIQLEGNLLECMLDNYGKDPRDLTLDHNTTQIMSCLFVCDFALKGAIYRNGTLNIPFLEKLYQKEIETSDFPVIEVFTETYYQCKKEYPDHCDWFFCLDSRLPPVSTESLEIHLKNEKPLENINTSKNYEEYKTLGGRIYQLLTDKYNPLNKIN
ncbi:uncharacterized protein LOC106649120 [Trichogramma pretiosum]|uniref:uncharacterized protein LOC106649120 n=1 Tax=Trichogramma pretiosum TaxID=7493 RepID=UPI0006C9E13D|nr:uncharacterized protein LOC106649120 [Trichogramma pretiosum]